MKVIWEKQPVTVRDVYETLLEDRKIAYTTVMTMMSILERKGFLKRSMVDRAYVYKSARPQKQVIKGLVRDFLDRVFNGSAEPLLLHLVEDSQLTAKDIEELQKSIAEDK